MVEKTPPRPSPKSGRETKVFEWTDSMKPIRSHNVEFNPADLILRSHAKHGVSKDGRCGTALPAAVLRDARESALLRTRVIDDFDVIRTSETVH
jgi:hypothetical protein